MRAEMSKAGSRLFDQVAARWQRTVEGQREYEVIRDGNIFATSVARSYLFRSEYESAQHLLTCLSSEYDGMTLDEALPGEEIETCAGHCHRITSVEQVPVRRKEAAAARRAILSDLKLVYGIGETTERRLRRRGYRTIGDLLHHPQYRDGARGFLGVLDAGDTTELMEWMSRWYPVSHPLLLDTSLLHTPEEFVFFDIETMGLFSRPIILFGVGRISGSSITVSQYLLRDIHEEEAAIRATLEHLCGERTALVTFNGRSFDLPYLSDRLAYYGLAGVPRIPHYDLLHFSRRRWKQDLHDCRLQTIEREILGCGRTGDVPGAMVPEFYDTFLKTGNPGPLVPIVDHNRRDVVTLARMYQQLLDCCEGDGGPCRSRT
jgi:uncharacterized protein YprB with RNaseH-like and TPR domain